MQGFSSRFGFLVAAGSVVGLDNIVRFSSEVGAYGCGLFLLVYLSFVLMLGYPLFVSELAAGRCHRVGLYG